MRNNLRNLRESRGWTLNEMADKTGYDFRTIAGYETNVAPSRKFIRKAAEVFKVAESEILSEDTQSMKEASESYKSEFRVELLTDDDLERMFARLNAERKAADKEHQVKILQTMRAITIEFERRLVEPPSDLDLMRKGHESVKREQQKLSSTQEEIAEAFEEVAKRHPKKSAE